MKFLLLLARLVVVAASWAKAVGYEINTMELRASCMDYLFYHLQYKRHQLVRGRELRGITSRSRCATRGGIQLTRPLGGKIFRIKGFRCPDP